MAAFLGVLLEHGEGENPPRGVRGDLEGVLVRKGNFMGVILEFFLADPLWEGLARVLTGVLPG